MMGFFDNLFDLNSDGKMDAFERMMKYVFITEEIEEIEEPTERLYRRTSTHAATYSDN